MFQEKHKGNYELNVIMQPCVVKYEWNNLQSLNELNWWTALYAPALYIQTYMMSHLLSPTAFVMWFVPIIVIRRYTMATIRHKFWTGSTNRDQALTPDTQRQNLCDRNNSCMQPVTLIIFISTVFALCTTDLLSLYIPGPYKWAEVSSGCVCVYLWRNIIVSLGIGEEFYFILWTITATHTSICQPPSVIAVQQLTCRWSHRSESESTEFGLIYCIWRVYLCVVFVMDWWYPDTEQLHIEHLLSLLEGE